MSRFTEMELMGALNENEKSALRELKNMRWLWSADVINIILVTAERRLIDGEKIQGVRRCMNCATFQGFVGMTKGYCHKKAPCPRIVNRKEVEDARLIWPEVRNDEWCGDWKSNDEN